MTDEKTRRPRAGKTYAGKPGGDKPMRRKPAATRDDRAPAGDRKPHFANRGSDKPRFDKPPRVSTRDAARPVRATKKPRVERPQPTPRTTAFEGERIAKAMARAGVCSRRDAENWVEQGRVAVNGRVLTSPAFNVKPDDKIEIDGAPMQARERTRLFLFHKPAGYVTSARDEEGRATVFSFIEERHADLPRVVSVGRLDINTEGLLLLTNDGGLARTLELPATGWTRRYRVRVHGEVDQARLDELSKGVTVEGVRYAPIEARLDRVQGANAWIAMSLTEGKNREIKRVMEHLALDVTRLIRISYGPFQLGELAEGAVEEVRLKTLREQLGKSLATLAGVDFASPLREATPTETQEQRQRLEKRSRKHVSVLRKQREEIGEKGPRARIERGATADRKGRAVAVERVTPTRRKPDDSAPTRNARRFEAMRDEGRPQKRGGARHERAPARGERDGLSFDRRRAPHESESRGETRAPMRDNRGGAVDGARHRDAKRSTVRDDRRASSHPRSDRDGRNESHIDKRSVPRTGASGEPDKTRRGHPSAEGRAKPGAGAQDRFRADTPRRPAGKGPPRRPRKGPPAPRKGR